MRRDEREALALANYGLGLMDVPRLVRQQVHKTDGCRVWPHYFCLVCNTEVDYRDVEWRTVE